MSLLSLSAETIGWSERAVLVDVDMAVETGESVAILGRSGTGKSTLVTFLYRHLIAAGHRVALIPQDHALVPPLSVFNNVYMGRLDQRSAVYNLVNLVYPLKREVGAIRPLLAEVGMADEMFRPVEKLSGGQKQRAAIARALFRGGEIILGDEPVSAIDEQQSRSVLETIRRRFPTMILALHDIELARAYCERIIGLRDGRVVLDVDARSVSRPAIEALYAT
jgi:phosphonate transport system ATP-binding protein